MHISFTHVLFSYTLFLQIGFIYIYIYMQVHVYICIHICMYIYIYMCVFIHIYRYTYLCLQIHVFIHTYTYMYILNQGALCGHDLGNDESDYWKGAKQCLESILSSAFSSGVCTPLHKTIEKFSTVLVLKTLFRIIPTGFCIIKLIN